MSTPSDGESEFEIAHVLCTDIIGYSKLLTDEQTARLRALNDIVRATEQFKRADKAGELVRLPTGDGMVLVFFGSPQAPVECAVEIAKALKGHPEIPLRMGVHSGPVNRLSDLNQQANVAGAGVNFAQRVMDCGDAGHILLSKRIAEDLSHFSKWRPHLHQLGECEVKHGVKVDLFNLCSDTFGNATIPERVSRSRQDVDAGLAETGRNSATRRKRMILISIAAVLLVAVAGLAWWTMAGKSGGGAAKPIESLAVKPLENLSGDPGKDYFADGMTDELTSKLSQITALKRVLSRSTMLKYKRSSESSAEIAREINVGALVEGSVVLAGNQARVSVQLVESATGKTIWAENYTRDIANIIQLQDQLTVAIANAIALKLTPGEQTRLAGTRVVNPEAYDYYLRGLHASEKAGQNAREENDRAIVFLEKAVTIDPDFAEAYAALSSAYGSRSFFFDTSTDWTKKAEQASEKSLQLNPNLPEAIVTHAELLWTPGHGFANEEVIRELRRAIAIAPNLVDAHATLGGVYFHVGLIQEAIAEYNREEELAPGEEPRFHLGLMKLYQRKYEEAKAEMQNNSEGMLPSFVHYNIALALYYQGKTQAAQDDLAKAEAQFADSGGIMASVQAFLLAAAGDKVHAKQKIEEAIQAGRNFGHFHHTAYGIAITYASMHENVDALKWLRFSADNGFPNFFWFERDPALDPLRKDLGFTKLLEEMRPGFERLKAIADAPIEPAAR